MTTFSILPVGYDIDLLRNGGNFILRNPPADYRDDKYWTLGGQVNTSSGWFSGIWGYITSKLTGG